MKREPSAKKKAEAWAKFRAQEPKEKWTPDPPVFAPLTPAEEEVEKARASLEGVQQWKTEIEADLVATKQKIKTLKSELSLVDFAIKFGTEDLEKKFQASLKKSRRKVKK